MQPALARPLDAGKDVDRLCESKEITEMVFPLPGLGQGVWIAEFESEFLNDGPSVFRIPK